MGVELFRIAVADMPLSTDNARRVETAAKTLAKIGWALVVGVSLPQGTHLIFYACRVTQLTGEE